MTRRGFSSRDGVVMARAAGRQLPSGVKSTGQLSLPAHMFRALPDKALFRAEWCEEGILYRFLGVADDNQVIATDPAAPEWTRSSE